MVFFFEIVFFCFFSNLLFFLTIIGGASCGQASFHGRTLNMEVASFCGQTQNYVQEEGHGVCAGHSTANDHALALDLVVQSRAQTLFWMSLLEPQ